MSARTLTAPRPARAHDPQPTDAALLAAIVKGDLTALGIVYDRYHRDVRRLLYRATNGSAEVDDIVQATFIKLPSLAASFDGRDSCRGWLLGISVRLAMRQQRGAGRLLRVLREFAISIRRSSPPSPEREASGREEMRCFERALARLSEKKRAVFLLVEIEGVAADEAAAVLEIPVATLRTRLFHARAELRESLSRGGVW